MSSKGRPWRTFDVDGFEVLIGRDAAANDSLTATVEPGDLWLHVADGLAGGHVVIRAGETAPTPVVDQAAQWAAWFSEARRKPSVEVMVVPGSNVRSAGTISGVARVTGAFTVREVSPEQPPTLAGPQRSRTVDPLYAVIQGALRLAITDHGPIGPDYVPSATKRVLGAVRAALVDEQP